MQAIVPGLGETAGAALASHWGMAADVVDAITYHHSPSMSESRVAAVVASADAIACTLGCGIDAEPGPIYPEGGARLLSAEDEAGCVDRVLVVLEEQRALFG